MPIRFPSQRADPHAAFRRPEAASTVTVNPPGFSWGRAGPAGTVQYRLSVRAKAGVILYVSPLGPDPVHIPDRVFPPGEFTWDVEALDVSGAVCDRSDTWTATIAELALPRPWQDPAPLLQRLALRPHPRLHLTARDVSQVRADLAEHRPREWAALVDAAEQALQAEVPAEPNFSGISGSTLSFAVLAFRNRCLHLFKNELGPLARAYVVTDDLRFGHKAAAILLALVPWQVDGWSGLLSPHGDQPGLDIPGATAEATDAVWNILSPIERSAVVTMLVARMDQMLIRLQDRDDFLGHPGHSHNGRMCSRLLEHAIVLADHPRAAVWADYALRALLTVSPHWAGHDGGWAEGVVYGSMYGSIMMPGLRAWEEAGGIDLRADQRWAGLPWYFVYGFDPAGELRPFGDLEYRPGPRERGELTTNIARILHSAARRSGNGYLLTKANQVADTPGHQWSDLLDPADPEPAALTDLPPDRCFHGVGHAFLHTHLGDSDNDFSIAFRSSPYGGTSHGHASQNDVLVQHRGQGLIIPGGVRFPHHGTRFHREYVQRSQAHNVLLVDGQGQDWNQVGQHSPGKIIAFQSQPDWGHVAGQAAPAYGDGLLQSWRRDVILLRTGILIIVDVIRAPVPRNIEWLLHTATDPESTADGWQLRAGNTQALLQVWTSAPANVTWTDAWPVDPCAGISETIEPPPRHWHGTWALPARQEHRVVSVLSLAGQPAVACAGFDAQTLTLQVAGYRLTLDSTLTLDDSQQTTLLAQCAPAQE